MEASHDRVAEVMDALDRSALSGGSTTPPSALALLRLEALIDSERFPPHERLPGEQRLAELLGVSRSTLREALRILEMRGHVVRRPGRGTYVVPQSELITETLGAFESVATLAARYGTEVVYGPCEIRNEVPPGSVAAALGLDAGAVVRVMSRTLYAPSGPAIHMRDYFSPGLLDVSDEVLAAAGVLRPLIVQCVPGVADVLTDIHLIPAAHDIARHLNLAPGSSILLTEERVRLDDSVTVELSLNYYNPTRVRFHSVSKRP